MQTFWYIKLIIFNSWNCGSHHAKYENYSCLRSNALYHPEAGDNRFLQNVCTYLTGYTVTNTEGHNLSIIIFILIFAWCCTLMAEIRTKSCQHKAACPSTEIPSTQFTECRVSRTFHEWLQWNARVMSHLKSGSVCCKVFQWKQCIVLYCIFKCSRTSIQGQSH
jgi:hypothetical protein